MITQLSQQKLEIRWIHLQMKHLRFYPVRLIFHSKKVKIMNEELFKISTFWPQLWITSSGEFLEHGKLSQVKSTNPKEGEIFQLRRKEWFEESA